MTVTGTTSTQTQAFVQTDPSRLDGVGRDITGSGVSGQGGTVPGTTADPAYGAMMEALAKFIPQIGGEVLDVLLLEITTKMKEAEEASQKDKIKANTEEKKTMLAEKRAKLDEATKKIEEQIEKEKNASIWDKIRMAFQALGALIMIAVGAVLAITGVGTAAGIAMMAIGAVMLVMTIDSILKAETGMGIAGNIAKATNPDISDEELAKIDMGFGIAMAAIGLIASIAAFFIPGNQVSAFATMAQSVATIANATISIATAAGDIYGGVTRYQAAQAGSEGKKLQAEAKQYEALVQMLDEYIDQAMQRLMGAVDRWNGIIEGLHDAIQDRANSVQKAALRA